MNMKATKGNNAAFDYDWVIVGSGFGGSVSALRLAEKGYRVAIVEKGKRYEDKDLPKSSADAPRYVWDPAKGLYGIIRAVVLPHIFTLAQTGVGGGSLMYGGVLFRPQDGFYSDPQWNGLGGSWKAKLAPFYAEAERMLGVTLPKWDSVMMGLSREVADKFGGKDSWAVSPTGVFFGEPGKTVPDPYFGGEGPSRTGCIKCGECMGGCRTGAANRLTKNYLWFAEKKGVTIIPEHEVMDVSPVGAVDGSEGYKISAEHRADGSAGAKVEYRARGVIFAGGAVGTNELLSRCKHVGSLPQISDRLGHVVRTNSEVIVAVQLPKDIGVWRDVTASSRVMVEGDSQIELLTLGPTADAHQKMWAMMPGKGSPRVRKIKFFLRALRHPLKWRATHKMEGWGARTLLMLVMQPRDNALRFKMAKSPTSEDYSMTSDLDRARPAPTYLAVGEKIARWLEKRTGGVAQTTVFDAFSEIPYSGHLIGGAVIGANAGKGVVDGNLRVFGYKNMMVCDASSVPANPGVNPALTITALAEHAMAQIPAA